MQRNGTIIYDGSMLLVDVESVPEKCEIMQSDSIWEILTYLEDLTYFAFMGLIEAGRPTR